MATKTKTNVARGSPLADDGRGIPEDGKLPLPKIDGHQLVVDEDIRGAIPPLSPDEREGMYNSLRVHGLFTPVTVVEMPDGTRVILDGHERLALWQRCLHEIEGWTPPLPLRADVLPLSDIVGKETDPAVCSVLLIARAIAINTARRQMPPEKVKDLIRNQLMREYQAGLQRSSTWLAAELSVALSWLIEVRKEMWDEREIPCPTHVLTKKGYQENKAFTAKLSKPNTLIKAGTLPPSGVFDEEPEREVTQEQGRTETDGEETADEEEADVLTDIEHISEEPDIPTQRADGKAAPSTVPPSAEEPAAEAVADAEAQHIQNAVETLDELHEEIRSWQLSTEAKRTLLRHASGIVEVLDVDDVRGQDELADELIAHLHSIEDWNHQREIEIPDDDLSWIYNAGFIKVDEHQTVSMVDKDEFVMVMASKFGPILKSFGVDPMEFESAISGVLNPKPTTAKKKNQKS